MWKAFNASALKMIAINSLFNFALIAVDEITPVWAALKHQDGGLEFTSSHIAILFGSLTPIFFISYLYLLPFLVQKYVDDYTNGISFKEWVVELLCYLVPSSPSVPSFSSHWPEL